MGDLDALYGIHVVGFLLFGTVVGVVSGFLPNNLSRKVVASNAVALFVTSILYAIIQAFPDRPEFRWLGYAPACGIFAYDTSLALRREETRAVYSGLFMALTLFTGFAAYLVSSTLLVVAVFFIGCVTYVVALIFLTFDEKWRLAPTYGMVVYNVLFIVVWSCYPVVFLLGPILTSVIDPDLEAVLYWVLELPAKYGVALVNIYFATLTLVEYGTFREGNNVWVTRTPK